MKKYKKTYAILNLAEKHTVFHLGKTKVHVSFTGGIVTKKGVTPATFTTDNPVVQLAIENSADFKRGAVTLQSKYPVQGEVKIGMNPPRGESIESAESREMREMREIADSGVTADAPRADQNRESPPAMSAAAIPDNQEENQEPPAGPDAGVTEEADAEPEQTQRDGVELEIIEASCKDVAKAYLQDHFGENPAPLRTRDDVQNCAAKYGITFKFD